MAFKPAIASMCLGRAYAHHRLPYKLDQALANGFQGIEVFYEDLEYLAHDLDLAAGLERLLTSQPLAPEALLAAAATIRQLCDERGLDIIGLQPFLHYEGLIDRAAHAARIEELKLWFRLAKALRTDVIQIPANFLGPARCVGDVDVVVRDLRAAAELGLREEPVVRFAYEPLCWSTWFDTWEAGWDLVERVDRPNFGLCLDTFNIAGRVYGDPAAADGKTPDAEADMQRTLREMARRIDVSKVFYVQVVDAERMRQPLVEGHAFWAKGQPARMSWSRNARLFVGEEEMGGYLPVWDVLRCIVVELGYKGWISMELFSRTMNEEGGEVVKEHARRGGVAWEKVAKKIEEWGVK